jgi:putative transposase
MARPLRTEFPGALYHVTARGNARQHIFLNDENRQQFLKVLERVVSRFHLLLHAYCLLPIAYWTTTSISGSNPGHLRPCNHTL